MHTHLCTHPCIYQCTHPCTHPCSNPCPNLCIHLCTHLCANTCTYLCTHSCTNLSMHTPMDTPIHAHIQAQIHAHTHTYPCIYLSMHTSVHTPAHTPLHTAMPPCAHGCLSCSTPHCSLPAQFHPGVPLNPDCLHPGGTTVVFVPDNSRRRTRNGSTAFRGDESTAGSCSAQLLPHWGTSRAPLLLSDSSSQTSGLIHCCLSLGS